MGRKSKRRSNESNNKKSLSPSKPESTASALTALPATKNDLPKPLIRIIDRLKLPFYDLNNEEDDGSDLQLSFRPRAYFACSLCCHCSRVCDPELFPCATCRMVYYCTADHRDDHREQHAQLCAVLSKLCGDGLILAKDLGPEEFRGLRVELLSIVASALGRPMKPWEREVLLYPRLCRVCHTAESLNGCTDCAMEYFCSTMDHRIGHEKNCAELRVFRRIMEEKRAYAVPGIPDYVVGNGKVLPDGDLDAMIREVFGLQPGDATRYARMDCGTYAALTQAASPALTVLHALRGLSLENGETDLLTNKSLTIHIIGAELEFECADLTVWEKFFLHLLPDLRELRLEFSGPELKVPNEIAEILEKPILCADCCTKRREIDVVFRCGELYHRVECGKPDLVCLFNPGLYRTTGFGDQDTWPATIKKFCDQRAPILITSYTEVELPRDLARVRVFRDLKILRPPRRNPFASQRPERNFVSDDLAPLIYKNYYHAVVRGLYADNDDDAGLT